MNRFILSSLALVALIGATVGWAEDAQKPVGDNPPALKENYESVSGTISDINTEAKTITVKGALLSKTLRLGGDSAIHVTGNDKATLNDLKVGDEVTVSYREQGDILWAHHITRLQPKEHKE